MLFFCFAKFHWGDAFEFLFPVDGMEIFIKQQENEWHPQHIPFPPLLAVLTVNFAEVNKVVVTLS